MKKVAFLCLFGILTSQVAAHDLWVIGKNGEKFEADMVYGHHFPTPEDIKKDRLVLFDPVKVIGENTQITLTQSGKEYHFEGDKLEKGVYIVNAFYKPTPWIQKEDGKWEMNKTRKDTKEAVKYCGISTMQSKAFVEVDGGDSKIIAKPLNKGLEIVPLFDSVSKIKEGELLKFKILLNGKPVKKAQIYASYDGYASNDMAQAGYAKSDLEGNFEFRALKKGLWYLKSTVNTKTNNDDCEIFNDKTTLVFEVK
ncbi:DUF4198 domain-containing protein [Campylobacter sp. FMV-PI01]|uniref:DUF4198 domain-containing protein n=1 Tax=Campylobacter portucalensis TaxID=2608384 RepID=A0A6L5WHU2_9BACT|nr:DUF4198 domain-containing protein [Campylobacter portucalensis]MSN96679.1 DUF4198 domain-containing protein [Campylobacter portucalensis]